MHMNLYLKGYVAPISGYSNHISTLKKLNIIEFKNDIAKRVGADLDIHIPVDLDDKAMLQHIAYRVEKLLKADPELLMSYMYRLDVEEKNIKAALEVSTAPVHITFAQLIWERQKQRIITKKKYKQDPIEGWEF